MARYIEANAFDERVRISVGLVEEELTEDYKDGVRCTLEMLKTQSTADVPQWIPCNERLPKEDGDYLVTLDFAWGKEIEMGEWFEGEWINDNSHVTVAWMPLPNPWKGEADGRIH